MLLFVLGLLLAAAAIGVFVAWLGPTNVNGHRVILFVMSDLIVVCFLLAFGTRLGMH